MNDRNTGFTLQWIRENVAISLDEADQILKDRAEEITPAAASEILQDAAETAKIHAEQLPEPARTLQQRLTLLARAAFLAGYYEALQGVAEAQEYVLNNAAHPQEVTP